MLAGRPPFAEGSAAAEGLQHLHADPPWPSSLDMRWALAGAAAKARARPGQRDDLARSRLAAALVTESRVFAPAPDHSTVKRRQPV